jgi:hypothetical protein
MATQKSNTISILHECCLYRAPALILEAGTDFVCQARFESVSLDSVSLCLFEEINHSLEASDLFISLSHKGECYAFFSKAMEYRSNGFHLPVYMTLQLPSKIIGMERRMSHRVVIGEDLVPWVRVSTKNGRILLPKAKDISLTGMMIEFDSAEDPNLQPPEELWLELRLDKDAVLLKSVIKQRNGTRYSLAFPEAIATNQGIYAPQSLPKIVDALERAWIRERMRLGKPEPVLKKSRADKPELVLGNKTLHQGIC